MKKRSGLFILIAFLMVLSWGTLAKAAPQDQYIYDNAHLLTEQEKADLQALSSKLGQERQTAFIIITVNGTDGKTLKDYVGDFYDNQKPGFDQPEGNTEILAIDMNERDVQLAGFKKAEKYLDDGRQDKIRKAITPDLSDGHYYQAFSTFIQKAHDYMGYKPGVNPDNILFKWWFQISCAIVVAAIIVGLMAYRSGGKVTVNARTYLDSQQSGVVSEYDNFIRKTVTRQRKPSNNSKSGGGGGVTRGGSSFSGSSGKF
ncbi:TPM domain-containing protein [Camelliibacillus cellulosilyticus]|uniref:TPM domain-containing protein n=1 Tax=Camelliibacillus cellulosilyticus TaxID=2174486 RepID=A0ABV9GT00_9BACL